MQPEPVDLAAWRSAQRRALLDQRATLAKETLEQWRQHMDRHIERAFPSIAGRIVAICWPHRNEYDARPLAARLRAAGSTIVLPVVVAPQSPLIFRAWQQDTELVNGLLGIPYPASGAAIRPEIMLLPVVGFDRQGYRLGYGGGYFDRTLAAMAPRPMIIGTAYELSRMDTLHPQPHDIPMDWLVTEAGAYQRDKGALVRFESG